MASTPAFRKGGQAAEEEAKKQNTSFSRNTFFQIKEDRGTAVIRLIDDEQDWIYTRQHSFVLTKGPDDTMSDETKKKWPQRSGAVCRRDPAFEGMHDGCYICEHMRKPDGKVYGNGIRLWARAVVRQPVLGTQEHVAAGQIEEYMVGQVVGYTDSMVETMDPKTNVVTMHPEVVVLNFSTNNFFGALQGYYDVFKTVLDRDFHVTRKGTGKDTDYSIIARDPIRNADGSVYDLRNPETRAKYEGLVDLGELITAQASDDHYARYFDPTVPIPPRRDAEDGDSAPASAQRSQEPMKAAPAANEPNEEQMKAMRERIKGIKPKEATEADEPQAAVNFG